MQIREAVELIYRLYSCFNRDNFDSNVGKDAYKIWESCEKNIVIFLQKSSPEHRIPFWNWINKIGVENIGQIAEAYGVITAIHNKDMLLPPELKNLYSESKNIAVMIGIIDQKLREDLIIWAESVLTSEEIAHNTEIHILSFTIVLKPRPIDKRTAKAERHARAIHAKAERHARAIHAKAERHARAIHAEIERKANAELEQQGKFARRTRPVQATVPSERVARRAKPVQEAVPAHQVRVSRKTRQARIAQPAVPKQTARPARVSRPVKTAPPLPQTRISNADPRRKQVGPPPKQGGVRSLASIIKAFDRK